MEHLHLEEPLEEGSACGDSLSSQHQAGRILRLHKGPQEEAGSLACMCVDETFLSTSCLVPPSWRMELELPHQSGDLGEAPMSRVSKRSRASAQHHLDVGQEGACEGHLPHVICLHPGCGLQGDISSGGHLWASESSLGLALTLPQLDASSVMGHQGSGP